MIRNVTQLEDGPFDVLVIGGGVYGAWTAYEAALRGFKTALIERNDWASGTSSASSKLIHGGLRYLEQFRFNLVRRSLGERRRLAALAPHRVVPLRFLIPVYGGDRVGRLRLRAGLALYDFLAGRNPSIGGHQSLTRDGVLSRSQALTADGLKGGVTYGDYVTDDARFALEIVDGVCTAGAAGVNYVEANELIVEGGRVVGATVTDRMTNRSFDVRASVVVNAAGPWVERVTGQAALLGPTRLIRGVHLVMPPLPDGGAMLIFARRDNRVFFVIPWYGRTLLGTTDTDFQGDADDASVKPADVDYLLGEALRVLPSQRWDRSAVLGSFVGVRTLRDEGRKNPSSVSREWVLEAPRDGLLVSIGGKYTSARADAADIVRRAAGIINKDAPGPSPTADRPFPWTPPGCYDDWRRESLDEGVCLGLDSETAAMSLGRFGANVGKLHALLRVRPELAARIDPDLPFSKAEVVLGASFEMATTLEDLLRRRIPLLVLNPPKRATLEDAAGLAAPCLGWTAEKCGDEVEAVLSKYRPLER